MQYTTRSTNTTDWRRGLKQAMISEGGDPPVIDSLSVAASGATAPVMVPGLHRKVSTFDSNQEDWIDYVECLELYFVANGIEDPAKKRAILLNAAGPSIYHLVKTLAIPGRLTWRLMTSLRRSRCTLT